MVRLVATVAGLASLATSVLGYGTPGSTLSPLQSITSGGHVRTFSYYRPTTFDPSQGLLMYLHGGGGSGTKSAGGGTDNLWLLLADRVGVLTIFPDGKPRAGDPTSHTWNDCLNGYLVNCTVCDDWDDVQFIKDLIPWSTSNIDATIDTTRVYVAGESEGGQMVERLALEANDVIAAVGDVAGNLPVSNDNSPSGAYKCQGYTAPYTPGTSEAVPILFFKGDADPRIPFGAQSGPDPTQYCQVRDGGTPPCAHGAVHSFYETLAFWQWKHGISTSPTTQVAPVSSVNYTDSVPDCLTLASCDGSTVQRQNFGTPPYRVVLDRAAGGGHPFPGPDVETQKSFDEDAWKNRDTLGQANPYLAEEMWAFFTQFTLAD